MIGRKATKRLAEFAVQMFSRPTGQGRTYIPHGSVYDFAFEHDFDKHFCNAAEDRAAGSPDGRGLSEFIMQIHTGESVKRMRPKEPPVALEAEGQGYLRHLAEALLLTSEGSLSNTEAMHLVVALNLPDRRMALVRALELDGYVFRDGKLLHTESSIVDIEQQHSALSSSSATWVSRSEKHSSVFWISLKSSMRRDIGKIVSATRGSFSKGVCRKVLRCLTPIDSARRCRREHTITSGKFVSILRSINCLRTGRRKRSAKRMAS